MQEFKAEKYTRADKRIRIIGPEAIELSLDYDDVDTDLVDKQLPVLIDILNTGASVLDDIAIDHYAYLRAQDE